MSPDRAAIRASAERLVTYVGGLPDFRMYEGPYDHIGATVADAILQANRHYVSFVTPRVQRIRNRFPSDPTTAAALAILRSTSTIDFLGVNDPIRAARFEAVLALFTQEGVETEADLREWLVHREGIVKVQTIVGIGPKTADYFKILVGLPESAMDRHLFGFLDLAGVTAVGYRGAQTTINAAADLLGMNRAHFDHSIWQYMSRRAQAARTKRGANGRLGLACDTIP